MSETPTRTCPTCRESIHAEARKCPRCQSWISGNYWWLQNPMLGILVFMLPMVFVFFFVMRPLNRTSANFGDHRDNVKIIDAKMTFTDDREGASVNFLGKI